jgi:hypothetical protein
MAVCWAGSKAAPMAVRMAERWVAQKAVVLVALMAE